MWNSFLQLGESQLVFLAGVLGMTLLAATIISCLVAVQWRKFRLRELELGFKDDMLNRGLSAADVELLWSGSRPGWLVKCGKLISACWSSFLQACASIANVCHQIVSGIFQSISRNRTQRTSEELAFKRELLDRGLSVEQIERLIAARPPTFLAWLGQRLEAPLLWAFEICRQIWAWCLRFSQKLSQSRRYSTDD